MSREQPSTAIVCRYGRDDCYPLPGTVGVHLCLGRLPFGRSLGENFVDFVLGSDGVFREILDDERLVVAFVELQLHPALDVVAVGEKIEELFVVQLEVGDADRKFRACELEDTKQD